MKRAIGTVLKPLDGIMKVIAAILRLFGLGGGSLSDRSMMPSSPKAGNQDGAASKAAPSRGLSPDQQQAMAMAILTYAAADKSVRKDVNLSGLPTVEKAFLYACDDKMLASIASMQPKEALDFVLTRTQTARNRIMRPSRKSRRREPESNRNYEASGPSMSAAFGVA